MKLTRQATLLDYDGFVEKFKPKKTTDECYTPQSHYDTLAEWLRANVPAIAEADPWLRPFKPGGDYLAEDYPEGCAVVDNPPFSILAQIVRDYMRAGVKFWLFAPALTLTSLCRVPGVTCVVTAAKTTYANGANVCTSFVTNCWPTDAQLVVSSSLNRVLEAENSARLKAQTKEKKVITYPDNVTSAARLKAQTKEKKVITYPDNVTSAALLTKLSKWVDIEIPRDACAFVPKLDCGQTIFGGGLLLSDGMAAELRAAELRAAELRAAELRAAELRAATKTTLSDREREAIKRLADVPKRYR